MKKELKTQSTSYLLTTMPLIPKTLRRISIHSHRKVARLPKRINDFFKTYDVTHDILSIKVLEQSNQKIVLEVTKESHNHNQATFTDHRLENVITLQKQSETGKLLKHF